MFVAGQSRKHTVRRKLSRGPVTFTGAPISSRAAALTVSRGTSAIQRSDRDGAGVEHVVPFFAFAPSIRKMIYTTNAVEALHRSLRKLVKTRGSFPKR
jgi:Transposase, Mutator family